MKASSNVVATLCEGQVIEVEQHFDAVAGTTGVNPGGGAVTITRNSGGAGTDLQAPAGRWTAGTIGGHPAALLAPVVDTVGISAVVVVSKSGATTDLTLLQGAGVTLQFLVTLGDELYQ